MRANMQDSRGTQKPSASFSERMIELKPKTRPPSVGAVADVQGLSG